MTYNIHIFFRENATISRPKKLHIAVGSFFSFFSLENVFQKISNTSKTLWIFERHCKRLSLRNALTHRVWAAWFVCSAFWLIWFFERELVVAAAAAAAGGRAVRASEKWLIVGGQGGHAPPKPKNFYKTAAYFFCVKQHAEHTDPGIYYMPKLCIFGHFFPPFLRMVGHEVRAFFSLQNQWFTIWFMVGWGQLLTNHLYVVVFLILNISFFLLQVRIQNHRWR